MRPSRLSGQELRLAAEGSVKYKGTACVRLDVLHFRWNEPRELSRKNVDRLKNIFRLEGVHRLNPVNHIPAIIGQAHLDDVVNASEISAVRLLSNPDSDPPVLEFPAGYRLACLHGRHRVQAGRETLVPTDAWWTVDLYLAGISIFKRCTIPG